MAGRKPKPTWLKIIAGNPGHRPLNEDEPIPEGELGPPPEWFDEAQKAQWDEKVAASPPGLLTSLDHGTLVRWAVSATLHAEAARKVGQYGPVVANDEGVAIKSPWLMVMDDQAKILIRYEADLGFTPSSRSRVKVTGKRKGKAEFGDLKQLGP